jgi:hypothetical protein
VSWLVAIVLALCVPFGQLRTVADRIECCCPDQSKCQCPDHDPDESGQPRMEKCHKQTHEGVANQLAAFISPTLHETVAPARLALAPSFSLPAPHDEPLPQRPAAPS